jgi:hypothetical protein
MTQRVGAKRTERNGREAAETATFIFLFADDKSTRRDDWFVVNQTTGMTCICEKDGVWGKSETRSVYRVKCRIS